MQPWPVRIKKRHCPQDLKVGFTMAGPILVGTEVQRQTVAKCHNSTRFAAHFRPSKVVTLGPWGRVRKETEFGL